MRDRGTGDVPILSESLCSFHLYKQVPILTTATLTPTLLFSTLLRRLLCIDSCLLVSASGGTFSRQPFSMCTFNLSNSLCALSESTLSPESSTFVQFSRKQAKFSSITSREGVGSLRSFSISPDLQKTKQKESRHFLLKGCLFFNFTGYTLYSMKQIKFDRNESKYPLQ